MTENQRLVWVLSMPVCASINDTTQMFSGVSLYEASNQHKDKSAARQARVVSDTIVLIDYLNERYPFIQKDSLFNIANCVTTQQKLFESMVGISAEELTFWKPNRTVTLESRPAVRSKVIMLM